MQEPCKNPIRILHSYCECRFQTNRGRLQALFPPLLPQSSRSRNAWIPCPLPSRGPATQASTFFNNLWIWELTCFFHDFTGPDDQEKQEEVSMRSHHSGKRLHNYEISQYEKFAASTRNVFRCTTILSYWCVGNSDSLLTHSRISFRGGGSEIVGKIGETRVNKTHSCVNSGFTIVNSSGSQVSTSQSITFITWKIRRKKICRELEKLKARTNLQLFISDWLPCSHLQHSLKHIYSQLKTFYCTRSTLQVCFGKNKWELVLYLHTKSQTLDDLKGLHSCT